MDEKPKRPAPHDRVIAANALCMFLEEKLAQYDDGESLPPGERAMVELYRKAFRWASREFDHWAARDG